MLLKPFSYPLNVLNKVREHFAVAAKPVSIALAQNQPEVPVAPDSAMPLEDEDAYDPLVRSWILRILIPLNGQRKFIGRSGFQNHGVAHLLNLTATCDDEDLDMEIETALREALGLSEPPEMPGPASNSGNQAEDKFCPDHALEKLTRLYRQSEQQQNHKMLPEPLASNLQQLVSLLGLSEVEYWVLAFTVLLSAHYELQSAYELIASRENIRRLRKNLSVILGFSTAEIRRALAGQSVLLKTSLVKCCRYEARLSTLSSEFAERLTIEPGMPLDWLQDMITPSAPPQLDLNDYPHLQESLNFLLPYLQDSLLKGRKGVNVLIHGVPGTGKTQLARVLAAQLAYPLYEVTTVDEEGTPQCGESRLRASRAAQMIFGRQPFLMLFDEAEDAFTTHHSRESAAQAHKAWTNGLLEENPMPILWISNTIHEIDPAFIRRFDWIIEVPVPPRLQRESIIKDQCQGLLSEQTIKALAACDELAPAVVSRTAKVVGALAEQFSIAQLSSLAQQLMDNTLQAQGHNGLNPEKTTLLPDCYDPELINCDADLQRLAEGLQCHGSARLCLFGPPGTGKTAWSRWLAEHLDKPLHVKRCSDLLSMWVGGTEKQIAQAFKEAEAEQAVLLIDEIDSILLDRQWGQRSWEINQVNEMLTQMESYSGILIATTNRMDALDTACLRRFDLKVKFAALKPAQAWKLLKSHCRILGFKEPDHNAQAALRKLDNLTPGDFSLLERQHRFNPWADVQAMIAALAAEGALKTPRIKNPIGFI